jgi:hypothetical protein
MTPTPQVLLAFGQFGLAAALGVVAAYIAWQQWALARQKVRLDLFDRRIEIYRGVKNLFSYITQHGTCGRDQLYEFALVGSQADFLFDVEVIKYNDDIYKRAARLMYLSGLYDRIRYPNLADESRNRAIAEEAEILDWFSNQYEASKRIYGKYLAFKAI